VQNKSDYFSRYSWLVSLSVFCSLSGLFVPSFTHNDAAQAVTSTQAEHPLLKQTREYVSAFEYKKALVSINKLLKIQPQNVAGLILRSEIRMQVFLGTQAGTLNEKAMAVVESQALADLALAQKREPKNPAVYAGRADLYKSSSKYKKAFAEIQKAIQLSPDNPEYYLFQASIASAYEVKQYWLGAKGLDKLVALQPEVFKHHFMRGKYYQDQGTDLSKPIKGQYGLESLPDIADNGILLIQLKAFNRALELNPDHSESLACRAQTHLDMKNYAAALADLAHLIAMLKPSETNRQSLESEYRFQRVEVLFKQKNYSEALAELEKIRVLKPEDLISTEYFAEKILNWQALIHFWNGQYALAEQDYLAIIKARPEDPDNWPYLMYAQLWQKKYKDVIDSYSQSQSCYGCVIPLAHAEWFTGEKQSATQNYLSMSTYPLLEKFYFQLIPGSSLNVPGKEVLFKDFQIMEHLGWDVSDLAQLRSQIEKAIPF